MRNKKKTRRTDIILNSITYLFSSFTLLILVTMMIFVISNGSKVLSFKLLTSDYYETVTSVKVKYEETIQFKNPQLEDTYFSDKWGVSIKDSLDIGHKKIIQIVHIDSKSPLRKTNDTINEKVFAVEVGQTVSKMLTIGSTGEMEMGLSKYGAKEFIRYFDRAEIISELTLRSVGGGIRGSLLTTVYLILLTLVIAIPLGIAAAIYLSQYAPNNRFTTFIRTLIDMTSGIPSILFGLLGAIIFIPFMNKVVGSSGGSIASGALTLSIMLLPIIIRTTEESIATIPKGHRDGSLALGASNTQTTFKIILPGAIQGILTSALLSVGRIIGESAALIYAIGTAIKDTAILNEKSTSLSVHIWTLMVGEEANLETACAISIVILLVVLILNILIKIISKKMNVNGVQ